MTKIDRLCSQIPILLKDENMTAKELSRKLNACSNTIHKAIRKLRERGIGIHPGRKGYILSEFATRQDDVHFSRRVMSRRVSDAIALQAAFPHIEKRWDGIEHFRSSIRMIVDDNVKKLKTNLDVIEVYRENKR